VRIPSSALLLGAALLLTGCDSHPRQLQRADKAMEQGDVERALELYGKAAVSDEAAVGGRALLAAADAHGSADPTAAESLCEEAIFRFVGSDEAAECLMRIAVIRRARSDWWGAIDAYRELLAQQPEHPDGEDILHEIARCYVELGDPAQALLEWTDMLERYPDGRRTASALLGVARCHDLAGDCGLAISVYRRVTERFPLTREGTEAMVGEAGCLEVLGELDAAEERYRAALESHPNLAMIELRLEELEKARAIRSPTAP